MRIVLLFWAFLFTVFFAAAQPNASPEAALAYCARSKSIPKDSLGKYARIAVRLSQERNDKSSLSRAYAYLARYYLNSGIFDSVVWAADNVDKFYTNDLLSQRAKNSTDMMRGSLLIKRNRHKEAIAWYYSIMDRVRANDTFNYLGLLHGIGWANMELQRFEEAKRWFLKVVNFPDTQYESSKVATMCNLAASYLALGQSDSGEHFVLRAIALADKHHFLGAKANALNIYADLLISRHATDSAERMIREAIALRQTVGDPFYIVSDMAQLSQFYASVGKYAQGIELAERALSIAREQHLEAKLPMILEALRNNSFGAGDYKKSASVANELLHIKDSLNNASSAQSLAEMEVRYETAERERKIQKQRFEIERKNLLIVCAAATLVVLLLLFYAIWKASKRNQERALQNALLRERDEAARLLLAAEEHEREQISETLHSGAGQLLSALKMNVQVWNGDADAQQQIRENALQLVNQAIREIRDLSHGLSPQNVLKPGLPSALRLLLHHIPESTLRTEVSVPDSLAMLPDEMQLILYRIAQEAVNNVLKHASAKTLTLSAVQRAELTFSIKDDGVGFDLQRASEGIGLEHISARVRYLRGKLKIVTAPNAGTEIIVTIPAAEKKHFDA